ncbi:hypothetical protein IGI04_010380 [Brassica rapa subsp. trilocularis]|uniref:Uncharacterized protein n=1 Tax=Brassica rapa subsp. trilocularis TaxID=1813537 RepID=A0ABQ7N2C5_BRACM|nr:hypothetical protein IGI04_010380 [Brassica rapa subsp. trilocularis]
MFEIVFPLDLVWLSLFACGWNEVSSPGLLAVRCFRSMERVGARALWPARVVLSYLGVSLALVGVRGFGLGCALVLNLVAAEASDGSSSTNFSRSVLDGYGRVVVLVSLTASSNVRVNAAAAAVVVHVGRCFEALGKLFSADDADWVESWDSAGGC